MPLWPAPVFLLGVSALVAVCLCRPLVAPGRACLLDRELRMARQLVLQPGGDLDQALDLATRALSRPGTFPAAPARRP